MEYQPTDLEQKVISIIQQEKTAWEWGDVWVTDKTHYRMREIIQKARKNYLGIFTHPQDEVTGRDKYFVPLTEDMTETIVKNIDLDSVDINIRSTNPEGYGAANILRYLVGYFMRRNYFGEVLNEMLRLFTIDGTVILKNIKNYDKKLQKQVVKSFIVDRTNFYIDPSAKNIQEAGAVIERNILLKSEIRNYPWKNKEYITETPMPSRLNNLIGAQQKTPVPYVEVYERWGELPIGKNGEWIPAVAIVSNIDTNPVVHVMKPTDGVKPYEECRFRRIFGRWDGRGIGEMLIPLQRYINETVNLRINAARIAQLGLFKIRKGSGITRQLLKSLISGGAIPVSRMEDIQELRTPEIKASSYEDEQKTYTWAQRVTGAWDVATGTNLPASKAATAAIIQEKAAKSGFKLLQQNFGMFLSRVFERHIIPLLIDNLKLSDVISIVGSPKEIKELDDNYINYGVKQFYVNYVAKNHSIPTAEMVDNYRQLQQQILDKMGKTRYLSNLKEVLRGWKYEVEVFVTGESFNKAVVVRQLNDLLLNYSKLPGTNIDIDAVFKEILDLMGIGGERFLNKNTSQVPALFSAQQSAQNAQPAQKLPKPMGETRQASLANTLENGGGVKV